MASESPNSSLFDEPSASHRVPKTNFLLPAEHFPKDEESGVSLHVFASSSCPASPGSVGDRTIMSTDVPTESRTTLDARSRLFFLFVNPSSGGNAAAAFTNAGLHYAELVVDDTPVKVWMFDIREGTTGDKPGFATLRRCVRETTLADVDELIYVIVAGGDGTVMWCTSEIWAHGIDDTRIVMGVVPYGTGNDFARVLAWNHLGSVKPYERQLRMLKILLRQWLSAVVVLHDLWEVQVTLGPPGAFKKIDQKTKQKIVLLDSNADQQIPLTTKTFKMCNYFSMGVESRIGIGFDRYRSTSHVLNKIRYGTEGLKKSVFKKTAKIQSVILQMTSRESSSITESTVFASQPLPSTSSHVSASVAPTTITPLPVLLPCASLIAINIPSFASGLDVWGSCAGRLGLKSTETRNAGFPELTKAEQRMGDGMLEFLSFSSAVTIGVEHVLKGRGRRIHQGRGPFRFDFHRHLDTDVRIYFQVDGEFFIMTCPKSVDIRWFKRVKVLAHPSADLKKMIHWIPQRRSLPSTPTQTA